MQWYGVMLRGLHKATQRRVEMSFETLASDLEDAKAKVLKAYDLSGVEIEHIGAHGKTGYLWPVIFKKGEFLDDGPKDIWIVPRNQQKPFF